MLLACHAGGISTGLSWCQMGQPVPSPWMDEVLTALTHVGQCWRHESTPALRKGLDTALPLHALIGLSQNVRLDSDTSCDLQKARTGGGHGSLAECLCHKTLRSSHLDFAEQKSLLLSTKKQEKSSVSLASEGGLIFSWISVGTENICSRHGTAGAARGCCQGQAWGLAGWQEPSTMQSRQ